MRLIGCEPYSFAPGALSPVVEAACAPALDMIAAIVHQIQVQEVVQS